MEENEQDASWQGPRISSYRDAPGTGLHDSRTLPSSLSLAVNAAGVSNSVQPLMTALRRLSPHAHFATMKKWLAQCGPEDSGESKYVEDVVPTTASSLQAKSEQRWISYDVEPATGAQEILIRSSNVPSDAMTPVGASGNTVIWE